VIAEIDRLVEVRPPDLVEVDLDQAFGRAVVVVQINADRRPLLAQPESLLGVQRCVPAGPNAHAELGPPAQAQDFACRLLEGADDLVRFVLEVLVRCGGRRCRGRTAAPSGHAWMTAAGVVLVY
jgi:hypothetical protein